MKKNTSFWHEGGKQDSAKKVPRISAVKQPSKDILVVSSAINYPQKREITQSADELKKLKIADLVQLLDYLTGHQLSLPKKPRKPDLISKITEIAILRSNYLAAM